jgi:hypothetical protein
MPVGSYAESLSYLFESTTTTTLYTVGLNASVANFGQQFGYGPSSVGIGGTVTQSGLKSSLVNLNKITGTITTTADALAGGSVTGFTLLNTLIASTDYVLVQHITGGTLTAYTLQATPNSGYASIYLRNITAGSLSEALTIQFLVIKSQTN